MKDGKILYLRTSWSTPPKRGLSCVTVSTNPNWVVTVAREILASIIILWRRWSGFFIFKLRHRSLWCTGNYLIRAHHLPHQPHLWRHPLNWTVFSLIFISVFFLANRKFEPILVLVLKLWMIPWPTSLRSREVKIMKWWDKRDQIILWSINKKPSIIIKLPVLDALLMAGGIRLGKNLHLLEMGWWELGRIKKKMKKPLL